MLLNSKSNFRLNSLIAVILSFCIFFTLPSISNAATSGNGMVSRSDSISKSVKASTITISKRYFYFNSDKYTIKEFSKILRNSSVNFYSIDVADSTSNHINCSYCDRSNCRYMFHSRSRCWLPEE